MIGWLIALAVVALLLWMKVGVALRWDDGCSRMKLRVGILRVSLSTEQKMPSKPEVKTKKNEEKPASIAKKTKKNTQLKPWLLALWQQRSAVLALLGRVLHAPTLDELQLDIAAGGEEPELTYGKIWAALGAGLPVLHGIFRVKKQRLDVTCRYDLPETQVVAKITATVRVYELLALAAGCLGLLLKVYKAKKVTDKAVRSS